MKRYVFLTTSARNVGGAQLYISRKMEWLKSIGWSVDVFFYNKGVIVIDNLKPFENNCIPELAIPFEFVKGKTKKKVLNRIVPVESESFIIESHLLNLGLWGEYIISNTKGMNLCYLLSETFPVISPQMKGFLEYKLKQDLLFGISPITIPSLLGESEKTKNLGVSAIGCMVDVVKDIEFDISSFSLDNRINILSLGRLDKPYMFPMALSIKKLASSHKNTSFNVIFIGDSADKRIKDNILKIINEEKNVMAYCTGYINPIPRKLIKKMDVAIASAGSVIVTMNEGILTIPIDGNDHMAIGIAGITTKKTLFRTDEPKQKIEDILEDVIFNKKYNCSDVVYDIYDGDDYAKHKEIVDGYKCVDAYNVDNWPLSKKQRIIKFIISIMGYEKFCKLSRLRN